MAVASQFLNTQLRGTAAEALARQLFAVLNSRLPPRLQDLSDNPEGSLSDLRTDQDVVGVVSGDHGSVEIVVERVARGKSGSLWLFSRGTLDRIPALYEEINQEPIDSILPGVLVNTRFAGILLYQWVAVLFGLPAAWFFTVLLNRIVGALIGSLVRRIQKRNDFPNPDVLPVPVRLLLIALGIYRALFSIGLPLLARQFWSSTASILAIAALVWLFMLISEKLERYIRLSMVRRGSRGGAALLRLGRRVLDVLVIFVGVAFGLYHFGLNPTAALAGLGVGGIAVALAAQKTLENVLGGISIIFDQAIRPGDTLQIGDTIGVVQDIGLRSTLIRTLERTLVSFPNGQVANLKLENLSARDKFWFHPRLRLRYDTTPARMQSVIEAVRRFLEEHSQVERDTVYVRFFQFGRFSLDLDISAYVFAAGWHRFLETQGTLLTGIREIVHATGAQIAFLPPFCVSDTSPPPQDQ